MGLFYLAFNIFNYFVVYCVCINMPAIFAIDDSRRNVCEIGSLVATSKIWNDGME